MQYILNSEGFIEQMSFGTKIKYNDKESEPYIGNVPDNYESLDEWFNESIENNSLNAWKIIDNNLVFDENKYNELQEQYKQDEKDNSLVLHKEIYGLEKQIEDINAVNNSQYQRIIGSGKVVTLDNIKATYPRIKIKNIECYTYDKIKIIVNGKNMLPNDAVSQTINGVEFKPNKDKSIMINGNALEKIEYNIAGSSTNTSPFFMFKKDLNYYLNSNGFVIKMYSYDGKDRTEIYSGPGGLINFTDTDKEVTHITLSIDKDEEFDNITIYPQLEIGFSPTDYENYKVKKLDINFSEFIDEGLFPSDNLFPGDELFPSGSTIDYILVENGKITSLINEEEQELENGYISVFDGYNTIYTMEDTSLEVECCINNLKLEGTVTKNNNFKILDDGSIEAHNGYFSGTLEADSGNVGGWDLGIEKFTSNIIPPKDFTTADATKIKQYISGTATLTAEELKLYDLNGDGKVTSADYVLVNKIVNSNVSSTKPGIVEINSKDPTKTILIKDGDGKEVVNLSLLGIKTPELKVNGNDVTGLDVYSQNEVKIGTWTNGKPLYRKVIILPNMGTDWGTYLYDVDYVTNISGYLTCGNETFPPNMPLGDYGWTASYWTKSTGLLHIASSYRLDGGAIVVEYTKTTD